MNLCALVAVIYSTYCGNLSLPPSPLTLSLSYVYVCSYTHSLAASSCFVHLLAMREQQLLLAYPMGLLYACFALIVMF